MSNKQCGLQYMHPNLNLLKGLNEDRIQSIYCNFISSSTTGHFEVVLEQTGSVLCRTALWYCFKERIDLVCDTRHIYTLFRTDGIKVMSHGISGCKQVIKFTNRRYHEQSERRNSVPKTVHREISRDDDAVSGQICNIVNSGLIQLRKGFI